MSTTVHNLGSVAWESGPDRKLTHNTYRETTYRQGREVPCVRFHGTVIIAADHDPELGMGYMVSNGGWSTSTTKQRLNALLPQRYSIYQKAHRWYVWDRQTDEHIPFESGMRLPY